MSAIRARSIKGLLLDALYPPDVACALCGRETLLDEDHLCSACSASLMPSPAIYCPTMLDGIVAGFRYRGGARDGVRALKYHNQVRLAPFFANAITLPQQAVARSAQGDSVKVVGTEGKIETRPVKVGGQQGGRWVILDGLQAGEQVMVDGFQ